MTLANQLTILRILLVPVFVYLLMMSSPVLKLLGVVVFIVASVTDAIDGYHARKHGEITRLGAFLDPLADKFLITSAFLVYVWYGYLELWMVLLVALRDVVVTVLRVYAEWMDRPVVTSREAKYKTLSQNILAYVIMLFMLLGEPGLAGERVAGMVQGVLFHPGLDYVMLGVTLFTVYTGVSYLVQNWGHLGGGSSKVRSQK
ncbi:MAG: CDP-diacylglycerol--glycerol-3-phosphate 3-phosphatidyltransferase [Prosthecochloris sp.]|uniref:CDP-diacylglycerol--glycerol-3-phosphate 3-phosphatidyltransferase n=1 Tax=Prosthecochloris sp. ZM_2 TaxID=2045206 RepID=UPI000DF74C46|nr:CDP-diacylglycerol--glycerol-3-phosphate 3-phosphatidyltransferase [Prosthecochloris sp. ZM_2]MEC9487724.1 CDP-diacylglycerol--glycerol-3-phosphate 3-phosphatidyltransferase [Prosthecochloris sp.]RNA68265.1 CDP-diacylglycerol--glycerol-3-phosphate 3-phosphatidyltransferase [Prosthecochloris sp. ZM_2]